MEWAETKKPASTGGANGNMVHGASTGSFEDQRTDVLTSFFQTLTNTNRGQSSITSGNENDEATIPVSSKKVVVTAKCKWDDFPSSIPIDGEHLKLR